MRSQKADLPSAAQDWTEGDVRAGARMGRLPIGPQVANLPHTGQVTGQEAGASMKVPTVCIRCGLALFLLACGAAAAAEAPTIFIAGDSAAANGMPGAIGWGKPFATLFDASKVNVVNGARGGR